MMFISCRLTSVAAGRACSPNAPQGIVAGGRLGELSLSTNLSPTYFCGNDMRRARM